ncbi:MAG: iron ABC transporter permease [Roseateles depolymerans]|uniref:Iron ABC transporter permease n=1 Tax=Roseateles depolymerans TaxID=76731 RepID=A0A2W5DJT4_9BURK|nr:MAG: iron ABC transporter permease [Roseateles depolymerans]
MPALALPTREPHRRWRGTPRQRLAALLALTLLITALCAQLGALPLSAQDWLSPPWAAGDVPFSGGAHVLWQLRLPRLLLALAVGAALALAGALAQALFRNPMADPALLGVTSGAGAAVALGLTLFASLQLSLPPAWRLWLMPALGFGGALLVCLMLERTARWLAPGSIAGLLLTGLALQALCFAVIGLCSSVATDEQLRAISFWTLGSLAGANWLMSGVMLAALVLGGWAARRMAQRLNALALGEAAASHIGVDVQGLRWRAIALIALLSALAVAWCGSIGFIGLIAPHLARQLAGADQRRLMPMAMVCGALLLVVADTLGRTVAAPAEVPVGVFSALIGAPWFLALLRAGMRRHGAA